MSSWTPTPKPQEPVALAGSLDRLLGRLGGRSVSTVNAVFDEWHRVVGATVAEHCWPIELADDLLVVGVDDAVWSTEVRYLEAEIVARVLELAPDSPVRRTRVVVRSR